MLIGSVDYCIIIMYKTQATFIIVTIITATTKTKTVVQITLLIIQETHS